MKRQVSIFGTAALALSLAACFYRTALQATLGPIEKTMDCPHNERAIDRADTMRWLVREDGGKLATRSEQRWSSFAYSMHFRLNAADERLRELLQLKRAHGCPPRATALPGMDDLALLGELESVQAKIDAGRGEEAGLLEERTRLFDGLRIVPATAAVPSPEVTPAPLK